VFYKVVQLQNKGEVAGVIVILCVINLLFEQWKNG